jgi:hypothetical protein
MAIQPIDLQTIFAQVDKVARTQLAQREGLAIAQAVQGEQLRRKADEQAKSVAEVEGLSDGAPEKVKDQGRKGRGESDKADADAKNKTAGKDADGGESSDVFSDPGLGKNIDISF